MGLGVLIEGISKLVEVVVRMFFVHLRFKLQWQLTAIAPLVGRCHHR
jgi:hypothetical protein